jgi:hypothetical protein
MRLRPAVWFYIAVTMIFAAAGVWNVAHGHALDAALTGLAALSAAAITLRLFRTPDDTAGLERRALDR